ncbi:MAG: polysaccharide pyruvyl transferase family protein [Anaerolineae bacterium]|nr:polysaccharide pyruvyl transferase family protein [Anaerolineae bacterium]
MAESQKKPRFALFGILGAYNYGTESIVRGTAVALRDRWPACEIDYISPRPEDDRIRLQDSGVRVVARRLTRRGSVRWGINAIFRFLRQGQLFISENVDWMKHIDCVLSIGGDLYTLPPQSQVRFDRPFYATQLLDMGACILSRGKSFVIWGASIGPFEAWPAAKSRYVKHLARVPLIIARETSTVEYLASVNIQDNVCLAADPAFLTPVLDYPFERKASNLPLVGVNLSPLSVKYALRETDAERAILTQAKALLELIRQHNVELVLLPHVIGEERADDDRHYLQSIYEVIRTQAPDRVGIVSDDPGARKMKGILAQCSAVIAARMHCGIHAISVGTPVLFLAYSSKARGMARYVYDDDTLCMPLEDFGTSKAESKIRLLLNNKSGLRRALLDRQPSFVRDALRAAVYLHDVLEGVSL